MTSHVNKLDLVLRGALKGALPLPDHTYPSTTP